jgi:uncharacterized cofD-like protein
VAIGGGHGLAATIRAVRRYAARTTAVVATADDGGSTGRLRSAMDMPAPGDIRRCLVAMAGIDQHPLGKALEYRFTGTDVEGHALGNLLLAALGAVTDDFLSAIDEVARLLDLDPATARVLPATVEPVRLRARTRSGDEVVGQVAVSSCTDVVEVSLDPPDAKAPDGLVDAVLQADQVVLGPGSLFTSVLAAAMAADLHQAIATTTAQRVYVCNLRAEAAETRGYDVAHHLEALRAHGVEPDLALVHVPSDMAVEAGVKVVTADLARPHGLAHDSVKLGAVLADLATRKAQPPILPERDRTGARGPSGPAPAPRAGSTAPQGPSRLSSRPTF